MSVGYAKRYSRFQAEHDAARQGGKASMGALGAALKYYGGQEGGLLGQAYGSEFTPASDRSWNAALQYRDELKGAYTADELKGHEGYQKVQGNINKFLGEGGPGEGLRTTGELSDAWNQFGTTEQTKGTGFLGGVEQMKTGLDTLTGGRVSGAMNTAGNWAMENLGGNFLKEGAKNLGTKVMGSSAMQGLGALASGAMAVAGPVMMAKQAYDFMNQTVDAYENLEAGVDAAEYGLVDLASQRKGAKDLMKHQNKAIARSIEENRGKIKERIGGQAEKVLTAYDNQAGRSNLETDMGDARRDDISDTLADTYSDTSTQLRKQRENLQLTNVEGYRRQNQGLMQAESDVQSSIDDMQQQMDDMEGWYKLSKGAQKLSPLAHIQGKV